MNCDLIKRFNEIIQSEESLKEKREFGKAQLLYTEWINKALTIKNDSNNSTVSNQDTLQEKIALAFNNRGQLKYLAVDFDGAVEDYNKALEYNSCLASGYYNRGTIFYRMGYFDKAVKDMTIACQLAPNCEEFASALSRCKKDLQNT